MAYNEIDGTIQSKMADKEEFITSCTDHSAFLMYSSIGVVGKKGVLGNVCSCGWEPYAKRRNEPTCAGRK